MHQGLYLLLECVAMNVFCHSPNQPLRNSLDQLPPNCGISDSPDFFPRRDGEVSEICPSPAASFFR
jgi:hypothetical protein